jgi:hypothetical protein
MGLSNHPSISAGSVPTGLLQQKLDEFGRDDYRDLLDREKTVNLLCMHVKKMHTRTHT